jgi:hypothetical protein
MPISLLAGSGYPGIFGGSVTLLPDGCQTIGGRLRQAWRTAGSYSSCPREAPTRSRRFSITIFACADTLLRVNYVEGGGTHPYVSGISSNYGRGWKKWLAVGTRFGVPTAMTRSAEMIQPTGPFALWAASMRFRDLMKANPS